MLKQTKIDTLGFSFAARVPKPDEEDIPLPPTDSGPQPAPVIEPPDAPPDVHNPGQTPVREPSPEPPKQIV